MQMIDELKQIKEALDNLVREYIDWDPNATKHELFVDPAEQALATLDRLIEAQGKQPEDVVDAPYGYCPVCGSEGITRERRPNGNDRCVKGHVYPSNAAIAAMDSTRTVGDLEEIIGTLSPIAEQDWHGKWRIQKAIDIAKRLAAERQDV